MQTCLKESRELSHHAMLVPLVLVERKLNFFAVLLETRAHSLEGIEMETGMKHAFSRDPRLNPPRNEREKSRARLDFDLITQKLTSIIGTLAFCQLTFDTSLEQLDLVMNMHETIYKIKPPGGVHSDVETVEALERRIAYLKSLVVGAQATRDLLLQRAQAQVQTVSLNYYIV